METQKMTTEVQTNWLERATRTLKAHLKSVGAEDLSLEEEVQKAKRRQMARALRDQRMSNAAYGYLKHV